MKTNKEKQGLRLPDIQEISTFQGKCPILRDSFFLANVATPPPLPEGFLPSITKDLGDNFDPVTEQEIANLLSKTSSTSAPGLDNINYTMISQAAPGCPTSSRQSSTPSCDNHSSPSHGKEHCASQSSNQGAPTLLTPTIFGPSPASHAWENYMRMFSQ